MIDRGSQQASPRTHLAASDEAPSTPPTARSRGLDDEAWRDPTIWSDEAEHAFWRQRRKARREQRTRRSHDESQCLKSFFDTIDLADGFVKERGIRTVTISHITGSVAKPCQFTPDFRPSEDGMKDRWKRAYSVTHGLRGYQPVTLLQVEHEYFVEDGHYRISVVKAIGGETIEANVKEWNSRHKRQDSGRSSESAFVSEGPE